MDEILLGDEYDAEPMSTDMLKDIRYESQFCMSINIREACYKIWDSIKQRRVE